MTNRLFFGMKKLLFFDSLLLLVFLNIMGCRERPGNKAVYESADIQTRWSSPENPNGVVASGGRENNRAKGHPYDSIPLGQKLELLNIRETGMINRIWITIDDRSPEMLRSLRLDMYWDDES